jgi:transcription-repair coupling factor (superfamily II helicase)
MSEVPTQTKDLLSFFQNITPAGYNFIMGIAGSFLPFLVSRIGRKTVFFYETEDEALLYKEELEFFTGEKIYLFPVYANRVFERDDEAKRIDFLHHLVEDAKFTGLFPYSATGHSFPSRSSVAGCLFEIRFGDAVTQETLLEYLDRTGYEQITLVREKGEYAKRGSIIDAFPPTSDQPVRVEFLGDEVYSIRFFDPSSQRSQKEMEKVSFSPSRVAAGNSEYLFDLFSPGMVLVHRGPDVFAGALTKEGSGLKAEDIRERLSGHLNFDISGICESEHALMLRVQSNDDLRQYLATRKSEIFAVLSEKLKSEWNAHQHVYLFAHHAQQAQRLRDIFSHYGLTLPIVPGISFPGKEREWGIVTGPLRRGFRTEEIILITEEDIVGPKKRVAKRRSEAFDEFLNSFKDLNLGDYVVHIDHGIGVYRGIAELAIDGYKKDFLAIEYQDSDKLYVPVDSLQVVQKYIAGDKHTPKIDRLGSQLWKNTKSRVKRQVEDIAGELMEIYARRQLEEGHIYPPEDELYKEMTSRFEYEETEGQLRAIEDMLSDMKSAKPMDRLICGDVGFGKTEVAIRASFKAVADNKQVAILVPTTILAQQHYKNFTERFRDYPINVDMLSRFRAKADQQKTLEGLKKGTVDVVIGTHRLLQKDLVIRDLGLLIIDEEHRFGVKHKEKLKGLKKNVDVLTLSATPIPRTLHMATTGIKDLSIINTPPLDRLAVKTMVTRFNDGVIKRGILNEIDRGGQVFFMHNFIHNIGVIYDHLKKLLPDARIAVAHGRMEGKELEKIMVDFIDRRYDILLSTNIIESGLDISNVNTIFINNAHRLGLADLYQLRGRVGRSTKQAYAYLLIPDKEALTRDASLRLKIIEELTELGSGFHIANYDLEIRGAGNLLGKEQSGEINLVGFELYCTMLDDTIRALKNKESPEEMEITTEINLPMDAFIPDSYIGDPSQKLLTYKRLSRIKDEDELKEMQEELRDRYGTIPAPLANLLKIIDLKAFLTKARVKKLEQAGHQLIIHVSDKTPVNMKRILQLVKEGGKRIKLTPEGKIILQTDKRAGELIDLTRIVLMDIIAI